LKTPRARPHLESQFKNIHSVISSAHIISLLLGI
jgi:hypothetical protein